MMICTSPCFMLNLWRKLCLPGIYPLWTKNPKTEKNLWVIGVHGVHVKKQQKKYKNICLQTLIYQVIRSVFPQTHGYSLKLYYLKHMLGQASEFEFCSCIQLSRIQMSVFWRHFYFYSNSGRNFSVFHSLWRHASRFLHKFSVTRAE